MSKLSKESRMKAWVASGKKDLEKRGVLNERIVCVENCE